MKNKKLTSFILTLAMVFTLTPVSVHAARYSDTDGNWAEKSINRWSDADVVHGNNGWFYPGKDLTTGQLAEILKNLLNLPVAPSAGFADVNENSPYAPAINSCAASGILFGDLDGNVNPNQTLSRERTFVILARALGVKPIENPDLTKYKDAADVSDYAKGYVAAMSEANIIAGKTINTMVPKMNINRAETVTILDRAIGLYASEPGSKVKVSEDNQKITLVVADDVTVDGKVEKLLVPSHEIDVVLTTQMITDNITITGADSTVTVQTSSVAEVEITGDNSRVILKNSNASSVTLSGENSKVITEGSTKIDSITIKNSAEGASVNVGSGSTVKQISSDASNAVVSGNGTVKTVASSQDIKVATSSTKVTNTNTEKQIEVTDNYGKKVEISSSEATSSGTSTIVNKIEQDDYYVPYTPPVIPPVQKADPTVTAPTAITGLVYTGSAKALITEGSTTGGTLKYAVTTGSAVAADYSATIPNATNAGTYNVWYKVVGDDDYNDVAPAGPVTVCIAKANPEVTSPTAINRGPSTTPHALVTTGSAVGGTLMYATGTSASAISSYSTTIPMAAEANTLDEQTYYVWYKVIGDGNHNDVGPYIVIVKAQCFAAGTKISMADGSLKNIENISSGERVLTFNHETGIYEAQKVDVAFQGEHPSKSFALHFTNNIELSIVGEHDLFEKESLKYVTITENNAEAYIGKHFYNAVEKKYEELLDVTYNEEPVMYYSLYTEYNMNCIANGMLSLPDDIDAYLNFYEFGEDLVADRDVLLRDIEQFGLCEYSDRIPTTRENFEKYNCKYVYIEMGKGLITWDELVELSTYSY